MICRYKVPCSDSVFDFDNRLNIMKKQLEKREKLLLRKKQFLNKNTQNNELLDDINKEYEHYIVALLKERKEQKNALENINNYIKKIIIDSGLTNEDLEKSNIESQEIINEIVKIENVINNLNLSLKC